MLEESSHRPLFEAVQGFVPELLVGRVLPDELLLLFRQLEALLYLHLFGGGLHHGGQLWQRERKHLRVGSAAEEAKAATDWLSDHLKEQAGLVTLFSPVPFTQHLAWPALSFISKSTHHYYLWASSP